ncbi:hypothetical protein CsSME_00052449 [Camellia sinensis var. sinensis]
MLAEVRILVDAAGFGRFCSGLIQMRAELPLYGALTERCLRVRVGGLIPCDPDMTQWRAAQRQLFKTIPDITNHRIVTEYDWGGVGLATLYCYMSSVSLLKADSLGGYWRVWEASRMTYVATWHASTIRILFEGPFGWAYYLGERFIG